MATGAAYRFIEKWFGTPVRVKPTATTATTSDASLVGNDPDRVGLTIINLGVSTIYVVPDSDAPASSTNGIVLSPQGGTMNLDVMEDGPLPSYGWHAIAASGTPNLLVLELLGKP